MRIKGMMVVITMTTKMTSAPEREGCTSVVHHMRVLMMKMMRILRIRLKLS